MLTTIFGVLGALRNLYAIGAFMLNLSKQINWKIAAPLVGFIMFSGASYYEGFREASKRDQTAQLQARMIELQAEVDKANAAQSDAEKRLVQIGGVNQELNKKVDDYVASLDKPAIKSSACVLTKSDVSRLRSFTRRPE